MEKALQDKGLIVTLAATGINLALGVLYTWSIFKDAIRESIESGGAFTWKLSALNDPYALCCLVFAGAMIPAGKCQDIFGPRRTAMAGGLLVGAGFIVISQSTSYLIWILGFGILVGAGIAFGYSSATPPALKWYPPDKTGKIAGIVVSGFGLASVYIAPLSQYLLDGWGLQKAMLFFGIAFPVIVCGLAMLLINPPEGYAAHLFKERRSKSDANQKQRAWFEDLELAPAKVIKSPEFWLLWFLYFIGAGAGLMVIGSVAGMAKQALGGNAFIAVALLAVGNAGGRIVAGVLSDKIGRKHTLSVVFAFQALLMFLAIPAVKSGGATSLLLLTSLIGFNYGANLSLFPSFTKDYWGIKNFGANYGILFTAWGVGGFIMSRASQFFFSQTDSFSLSFLTAGILLILGASSVLSLKPTKAAKRREIAREKLLTDTI